MGKLALILIAGTAACLGLDWALGQFIDDYVVRILKLCCISVILAVSLNVINGLCGQFSLGHAGFMAIGAYVSALFTTSSKYMDIEVGEQIVRDSFSIRAAEFFGSDVGAMTTQQLAEVNSNGFLFGLIAGGIAAAFAGLLVGLPTLRLRGDYLAIATLGFGEIVRIGISNFESIGAARGLSNLPNVTSTFWVLFFAMLIIALTVNLQRSTFGRALVAIRENEVAAEVMGIRVARMKVIAFIYGAFFAGIAGGLFGHLQRTIGPDSFTWIVSVEVVVMLVLGGLGSMTGAIVGAIALTILPELLRDVEREAGLPGIRMVIYALILILLMIFRPQGIFGQRELSLKLLRSWLPGKGRDNDQDDSDSASVKEGS
ncbi:branched-chain amino acid ABC transporter permease [Planctomycetota bacterium]|nr:branched-chain amino acid ABC transporter permease [Planctomycetota bacterium]